MSACLSWVMQVWSLVKVIVRRVNEEMETVRGPKVAGVKGVQGSYAHM